MKDGTHLRKLLYVIRHGESLNNVNGILSASSSTPLTDLGKYQATRVGIFFRSILVSHIFSSDIARAIQTAEEIKKWHSATIIHSKMLREIAVGEFEGKTLEEFNTHQKQSGLPSHVYVPPGGETVSDVMKRIDWFIDKLKGIELGTTIIIVGHSGLNKLLIGRMINASIKESLAIPQSNAGITLLTSSEPSWHLDFIDSTTHLDVF